MNWPFITRRRHDAEVAELRKRVLDTEARHDEAEDERRILAARLAVETAANKSLTRRVKELGRRLDAAHDTELGDLGDITLLEARAQRLEDELVAARAETDVKVAAAEERGRQAARGMSPEEWQERPVDGAPAGRREPSAELRQANDRCLRLADQLAGLQASHVADTRELHDLRSKGGAS